jgi:hypothetical protein
MAAAFYATGGLTKLVNAIDEAGKGNPLPNALPPGVSVDDAIDYLNSLKVAELSGKTPMTGGRQPHITERVTKRIAPLTNGISE